ncbi:hypothetical protein GPL21_07560 [Bradyrhizobium pachyrhizi]|uniref:Serine protease n=1 Tax=Bradyrhizobium pachyrhizi TaxID=280333 RepID=A0A844SNI1_9BRAD|nr:hypothetical protein [Bradyrhizobium pachyrhizi]MVT64962.1 hypothetical protein [Bradyrhizobium pachyrhizi]
MSAERRSSSPAEWPARCEDVLRRMYDAVSRFTVPISISLNDMHGKHLGTGSFVDLGGIITLVSCEHVIGKRRNNNLAHRVIGIDRYIALTGPGAFIVEPVDVGVAAISSLLWDEYSRKSEAIPESRLVVLHDAAPNELFFVFGFAEESSHFFFDTLEVNGTAYLCREAPLPSHSRLDRQIHFALEYNRDLATKVFGEHGLPKPVGMGGSLVWNTRFVECSSHGREWEPGYADVAGMIWFWSENDVIAATRVEYVRSFLLTVAASWGRDRAQADETVEPPT